MKIKSGLILIFGLSLAFTACKNSADPTVTSVTVSPAETSVAKGKTKQFIATVKGSNSPDQTVTWEVTGGESASTLIDSEGTLSVAADETAETLTVVATSTADTDKYGEATVTVTGGDSGITVSITGTAQVGSPLAVSVTGGEGAFYQWKRANTADAEGTPIPDATSPTYTLTADDQGKYITVTVTVGGSSVTSPATVSVLPADAPTPTVSSVTISPSTVSVNKGATQQFNAVVNGTNSPAQTVTWTIVETNKNASTNITSGLLTINASESLATLTVRATSTEDPTKYGDATVTVTTATLPALTGSVSISGTPQVGQSLTANTGSLQGSGTIGYQWTRGDTASGSFSNISSANSSTYNLAAADLGKYIKLTVTRANNSSSVTSAAVGAVVAAGITTTPLDLSASGVQVFTSNSSGNKPLTGSSYGYEMWTEGGNNNKLTWYGPNQGGGAAFRAEWNNPNDFLGRVGYFWNQGKPYTDYKNVYCDFNYTRSGRSTAGSYSYIGVYGWSRNPSAADPNERLIEYYIVEDWFGNSSQSDTSPMGLGTTGGSEVGSYTMDGATYKVVKNVRVSKPSIDGETTFTQFFSIRQTLRKTGTISVTEHFKKWDSLNMKLGSNIYECKFLVEAGGGTGWLEFTYLKFSQEDNPR